MIQLESRRRRHFALILLVVYSALGVGPPLLASSVTSPPVSFNNRLLINKASISGQKRLEVMLLLRPGSLRRMQGAVSRMGGHVEAEVPAIDYLRVEVPISCIKLLAQDADVASYQIDSGANMIWWQEGRTEDIAQMYRGYEVVPVIGEPSTIDSVLQFEEQHADLPLLTPDQARAGGYSAEDDTGVTQWLKDHPSADGRGVTIAFLESGRPQFDHSTLRAAKDIDGHAIDKFAFADTTEDSDSLSGDSTRVPMKTVIHSRMAWIKVSGRTYILPKAGTFRFGTYSIPVGGNLKQEFALLWDTLTGEIWVDTDGDADFRNEIPMRDVHEHLDIGKLQFTQPGQYSLSFVVAKSLRNDELRVYTSRGGHQAMSVSVAAGSRTEDGVAFGVAPNARVLVVRNQDDEARASGFIEGYAAIASRADVDLLSDSRAVVPMPDTADGFYSLTFQRIAARYHKPIFHGGGNGLPSVGFASALDGVFVVGGSISSATYAALFGGRDIENTLKHPLSSEGPGGDGGFKPDFLAPMHRLAADSCAKSEVTFIPKNAPTEKLPPCTQISCCTSASGPYAAGIAALLISASRQQHRELSVEQMGLALRASAHYLEDSPAYAQGAGVLDINAAWAELQRKTQAVAIDVRGPVKNPMMRYAPHPGEGAGLFEVSDWAAGQSGQRLLSLKRKSGSSGAMNYRVTWTGNDGTFSSEGFVRLPLNKAVQFPIEISVKTYGAHSAILNLHDPVTGAVVLRSMATIVAPQPMPEEPKTPLTLDGKVSLMHSNNYYIRVPDNTAALRIALEVQHGALFSRVTSLDPTDQVPNRPLGPWQSLAPGKYVWVIPKPSAGTLSISLTNQTGWIEQDPTKVSTDDASYALSISSLNAELHATANDSGLSIQAQNRGVELGAPVADVYPATRTSATVDFLASGAPNVFSLQIPDGSDVLRLHIKSHSHSSNLESYLYDCTSGQCFYWDYGGTASQEQTLLVHRPKSGRWVVAINAAPSLVGPGGFTLEKIIGTKANRYALAESSAMRTTARLPSTESAFNDGSRILYCELVDAQLQDEESKRLIALAPAEAAAQPSAVASPVAIASTVYKLH